MAMNKVLGLLVLGFISIHISECKVAKQENLNQGSIFEYCNNAKRKGHKTFSVVILWKTLLDG